MTGKMQETTDPLCSGIRDEYARLGVETYYQTKGDQYTNPHFEQVRQLLIENEKRIDYSNALDFCCGSGEVSLVLRELGYPLPTACDPYTHKAYQNNFDRTCLPFSFADVIRGKLKGQFSTIICSFALHLCPGKQHFPLVFNLFQCTDQLVVITPHKRPALERLDFVTLKFEDAVLTQRKKKVRLKSYTASKIGSK